MALPLSYAAASGSPRPAKSPFFPSASPLFSPASSSPSSSVRRRRKTAPAAAAAAGNWRRDYDDGLFPRNYDRIPKQFREENLKDGLMDNYKNVPQFLYGLSPAQMDMFVTEDSPLSRQAQKVTEESISAARSYSDYGGMYSFSGMHESPARHMSMSMYGGGRRYGRPEESAPDLPSLLLDARIVYLGMPIVPAVTELIAAQFLWLDFDDSTKPVYLYINSSGAVDENGELVAADTEAYAVADFMNRCRSKVYTVNLSMAYGQAAMLLSLGEKGKRGLLPHALTKLHLPIVYKSGGAAIDMWIKAKELETSTDYFLELLSRGVRKPVKELAEFLKGPKYFDAQEAIDYGIADRILYSLDGSYKPKNIAEKLANSQGSRLKRKEAGAGRWGPKTAPR